MPGDFERTRAQMAAMPSTISAAVFWRACSVWLVLFVPMWIDDDARMQAVELAAVEPPEDVLRTIPAETEIQHAIGSEDRCKRLWTVGLVGFGFTAPEMRDRVAD